MSKVSDEILAHIGTPHVGSTPHSGRYKYGSGEQPYQNGFDFLARCNYLKDKGLSEKEIADSMKLSTTQLRTQKSIAKNENQLAELATIIKLKNKDWANQAIADYLGYNSESSIRNILNQRDKIKESKAQKTANVLKEEVDKQKHGMLDVGKGVEDHLGVSEVMKDKALYILKMQGYNVYGGRVGQVTNPEQKTTTKVLTTSDKEHKDIYQFDKIGNIDYGKQKSKDGGKTFTKIQYPKSLDSKRLQVLYGEEGGKLKDGIIEIRPGVKDLTLSDVDLGPSKYSQVRILVDGKAYLKGVALYSNNLPKGVDVRFNTNKPKGTPVIDPNDRGVLKNIKKADPNNPFGSLIDHQNYYLDKDGKKVQSLINVTRTEGDWEEWKKTLPSQFLGKQPKSLIKKQIDVTKLRDKANFEDIMALNNNVIKRKLLKEFSDECDTAAVELKMMSFPRQKTQVILPLTTLKDNEIYAPNYKSTDTVALVRFPHAGQFEIPICKVNNKNKEGKELIGPSAKDAIGINQATATILSGADFDGDTVLVIPITNTIQIKGRKKEEPKALEDLKKFDPALEFPERKGMTYMTKDNTQKQMGIISNLITDMQIEGATPADLARAVKHSMVVIDAEKHKYDYKLSEKVNNINELKKKYQRHEDDPTKYGGATTLLSKAKSEKRIPRRVGSPHIEGSRPGEDKTGKLIYKQVEEYYKKNGKDTLRTTKTTQMADTDDARTLISSYKTPQEIMYADYANFMKNLGNEARKAYLDTPLPKQSKEAKVKYAKEVESLNAKLRIANMNKPLERKAQFIANARVNAMIKDNPEIKEDKQYKKKLNQQAIERARAEVGADSKGSKVVVTDKEWEAIQANAISATKLNQIIYKMDADELRKLATPKGNANALSPSKISGIKAMLANGYTNEEIANRFGISVSTVIKYS